MPRAVECRLGRKRRRRTARHQRDSGDTGERRAWAPLLSPAFVAFKRGSGPLMEAFWQHRLFRLVWLLAILLAAYLLLAYVVVPGIWRVETRHPALDGTPRITHTSAGIPGDPLNVALVGTKEQLITALLKADWHPADPLTLRSCLAIAVSTVFRRPDVDAPVSNLYVWGRKQDLAFEQPVGDDARRRHHVRFWMSETVDEQGRPLWIGAATFDTRVGFSHTTGQITHHISPDVDAERDKVIDDLRTAGMIEQVYWIDDFQEKRAGRNGGGDPYHTDGRLAVGVLVP